MTGPARGWIAAGFLVLCVALGGASAAGAIVNAVLQGLSVVILLALIWTNRLILPVEARPLAWLVALFLGGVLLTLVPLPHGLWSALPFRGRIASSLDLLGLPDASLPLSLAPAATVASLLWLLPPAAMFFLTLTLGPKERRRLGWTLIIVAVVSITLGVMQLVGGDRTPLYFYAITNHGSPVGFFSNINHQATLLLCALPCAAVVASHSATRSDRSKRGGGMVLAIAIIVFLCAGILVAGSMAGYGLLLPAAFGSLLIYRRATVGELTARWKAGLVVVVAVFIGFAVFGPVSQQSLTLKYNQDPSSRRVLAETTIEGIADSFPVGTGLGTFANVYRTYEDPLKASREYANHAHNDYVEFVLELGALGGILILLFIVWWARRTIYAWRTDLPGMRMAEPAAIMIGIVLLHSAVDYPLRTSAIAAVCAMACAMLVPPPVRLRRGKAGDEPTDQPLKHLEATA